MGKKSLVKDVHYLAWLLFIILYHVLYMDSRVGNFGWSKWHLALPSWRISTILTCEKGEAKTEGPIHERRTRPSEPMKDLQKLSKHLRAFSRIVWKFCSWPSFPPCIWFSTFFQYLHWNVSQILSLCTTCWQGLKMLHQFNWRGKIYEQIRNRTYTRPDGFTWPV